MIKTTHILTVETGINSKGEIEAVVIYCESLATAQDSAAMFKEQGHNVMIEAVAGYPVAALK
jgi:hypothetical protein